jgi:hypothetical protein
VKGNPFDAGATIWRTTGASSQDAQLSEMRSARDFFNHSFSQLRFAYRLSTGMSAAMFLVGLSFLVIAGVRLFTRPESIASSSVIGGIGIVQIVMLFYRNPLADIARTVSNSQQAKLAILSFLMGVELLNRQVGEREPTTEHLQSLTDLTDKALHQLQPSTEQLRPEFEKKRSPARRSIQKGSESAARLPRTR